MLDAARVSDLLGTCPVQLIAKSMYPGSLRRMTPQMKTKDPRH